MLTPMKGFEIISEGVCAEKPGLRMTSKAECQAAAQQFGKVFNHNKFQNLKVAGGCLWSAQGRVRYNPVKAQAGKSCGVKGRDCICAVLDQGRLRRLIV